MKALQCGPNQLVVDSAGRVLHLGPTLPLHAVPDYRPQVSRARTAQPSWPQALPLAGEGWFGVPGLAVHADGDNAQPRPSSVSVSATDTTLSVSFVDGVIGLRWSQHWRALGSSGTFEVYSDVSSDTEIALQYLASAAVPVTHATEVVSCAGGWTREGQLHRHPLQVGGWHQTSRLGRSGHDHYPAFYVNEPGRSLVFSLAWSGDHQSHVDVLPEGQRHAQIGEHLSVPLQLAAGSTHQTPSVLVAAGGSEQAAQGALHAAIRDHWLPVSTQLRRDVHLNSWEAVYFDHNLDGLSALSGAGERAGVERFVLDDGWFGSRRNDETALGDWHISPEVWPDGFAPLVRVLKGNGQNFGLWVEPEMVSPDSDLARTHPEWVLGDARYDLTLGRQQWMLDLGLEAVQDALFEALSAVLAAYPISYLKWDHNRIASQPRSGGRYGVRDAVLGVYRLWARLREAFPALEIESCASGGGRMDLGALRHCYRVWTSDCNDPIERALMQPAMMNFLPPEV
ncbi:MAG: alpha-galactosidase, partial [Litorivicinus sp.]